MTDNHRRKWRVLGGLLLLLCLVSLLLLPFRNDEQAAPESLAGIEPTGEPPSGTAAASGELSTPTIAETRLLSKESQPTAPGEAVAAPTATETSPSSSETAAPPTATATTAALSSAPTATETRPPLEETTPVAGGREGGDDTAIEFNAEVGTGTPEVNEAGSNEPVGTAPATSLTVTATLALIGGASTGQPATEKTAAIASIPVVETEEPVTPTVTISATGEAAAEITSTVELDGPITSTVTISATMEVTEETVPTLEPGKPITPTVTISALGAVTEETTLTVTSTQESSTLPGEAEPTATSPRPAVVDPIMEHMAGERVEGQPEAPAGASPSEPPEPPTPDPVSAQPDPNLAPGPEDVPAPDNLPTTGLLVEAPAPPFWVAGGVTILLLAVGVATLLKRCE